MSNDGRRSSATKPSPEQSCQRNRNNNHPSPKTSQSYPKLSKEIYIELAAFSDSIYDRGRLLEKYLILCLNIDFLLINRPKQSKLELEE
jgi:hypothetical protein